MTFFDTTVLVAAFQEAHLHHAPSLRVLEESSIQESCCSLHTLADFYATTTRLPGNQRFTPEQALHCIQQIEQNFMLLPLSPEEYLREIRYAVTQTLPGAMIYDGLLLACAREAKAERIYTWNIKHFRAIAPDIAGRIVTP